VLSSESGGIVLVVLIPFLRKLITDKGRDNSHRNGDRRVFGIRERTHK
jgi:hypothetical protein